MDGANSNNWWVHLSNSLAELAGPSIKTEIFWGITRAELIIALAILALTALVEAALRSYMRRQIRQKRETTGQTATQENRSRWIAETLDAFVPPLALLIWTFGFYSALTVFFGPMKWREVSALVLAALVWFRDIGAITAMTWFLVRWGRVVEALLLRLAARAPSRWDDILAALIGKALRMTLPCVGLILVVPLLDISVTASGVCKDVLSLVVIGGIAYALFQLLGTLEQAVLKTFHVDVSDNLSARKIHTQVKLLKRVAGVIIVVFTVASMLMVFDSLRHLGTSIMASAGLAGVVLGFGAQRSLAMLVAGFQIAITQPIRLDDVVIVETEWGWIEEITLTYVVVRIWDLRRLIVPTSSFIEKPFQNWTRVSADLLGTVFLYVDYTVPLNEVRAELDRILAASKLWDKKVKVLQVTDSKEHTLELRALASAANSSICWDLRCEIREKLVDFLQRNYPQCLPKTRAEFNSGRLPAELTPQNGNENRATSVTARHS